MSATKIIDCNFTEFAELTRYYDFHPFLKPKPVSEDLETIGKYVNAQDPSDYFLLARRPSNLQHLFLTGSKDDSVVYQRLRY